MFQNLKIIIRRQKRLILIFLLTILLPSVTLSIFGLIALRNEKYRFEQQFREKQISQIDTIRTVISQQMGELENEINYLVRTPSLMNRDYQEIHTLVENHLGENHLSGQIFLEYGENEPWFPPFQGGGSGFIPNHVKEFSDYQKRKLEEAENYEFVQKNYPEAVTILKELLKVTDERNLHAQVLNRIARNYVKQNLLDKAIVFYREIIQDYPNTRTSSGTLLPISVHLQLVECYIGSGMQEEALKETLLAFEEIIQNQHHLSENQLSAYVSMTRDKFGNIRDAYPEMINSDSSYLNEFENLNNLYQLILNKWQVISILKNECLKDISKEYIQDGEYTEDVHRYSKRIGDIEFLIISSQIPDEAENLAQGIAGISINNTYLKDSILADLIRNAGWNADDSLNVTDMSGHVILGTKTASSNADRITSMFEANFPPWRIEVSTKQTRPFLFSGLIKSYYFWTILAMMAILGFGIVITGRIIAHEKEILRMKSDFISSVSHEFKTPITSIKALTERLLEGSVKDQNRRSEYYSIISQDAESLSHLVANILDFSKMEEGKEQYQFEETNFIEWLEETIRNFFSRTTGRRFVIHKPEKDTTPRIKIDRNAMKLAINNLLDNAAKFSSEDSEIRIFHEKQENKLMIKIMDDGIGVPKNEQAKIFEKFYRGRSAQNHSITGTGLGLTIVKKIIEDHGGEILVESEPGRGSAFTILLPIRI
jgi:signal transduction histidine kinase